MGVYRAVGFKSYCSGRWKILYNILDEFGIDRKIVCNENFLNDTCSIFCIGRNLSEILPIQMGQTKGEVLLQLLLKFVLEYSIGMV
jgi:hypothetical protein